MRIRNFTKFISTGLLVCLTIGACSSPQRHAEPEAHLMPLNDVVPTETEPPIQPKPVLNDDIQATLGTSLMQFAPAAPALVVQIKDVAEALARVANSKAWQQISEAPFWEMVWAVVEMESGVREVQRLPRPGLSILSHLLGQEILLVVPEFRGILEISPALLIQIDRSDDLGEVLASAIEVASANIPGLSVREYNGYSYQVTEPIGPGRRLSFGLIDDLLIASFGEATLKTVIDLYQGDSTESLANDAEFMQMMTRFQAADSTTDFQSTFYIDVATIYEFAKLTYPMAREGIPENIQPLADRAVEWLDLVQSVTAVSNITKDGLLLQSYTHLNPEASANNFLAMLQVSPVEPDSIQFVPADSAGYGASNLIDLPKLWKMAMDVVSSMTPEISKKVLTGLDAIQTQFNFNIETDLFSWMGSELALINHRQSIYMPREGTRPNLQRLTQSLPRFAVLIETTDSVLATENLRRLTDLLSVILASSGGIEVQWQTVEHAGTQIRMAEIPDASTQFGYAVTDKYVLIAPDASLLKTLLDCATGVSENLSTLTQFQDLRALTPQMVNTIGYANPVRILTSTLDTLVDEIPTLLEENSGMRDTDLVLAQAILPQAIDFVQAVAQVFVGQIQYSVKDGDGLRGYSLLKTEDLDEIAVLADPPEAKIARSLFIARGYMESGMMDRAGAHLDRILELDEAHPDALMMKVALLEAEGNEKRANWYRRRLGFAPESAWHIIGPFPNPDGEGFDTAYPPETEVGLEATYETESGSVTWETHRDDNKDDGFVNLREMFEAAEWKVGYAWTTLTAPEAREVELRIGSDDDIKVWFNGIDVLTHQVERPAEPDQDRVNVSLQRGVNQILVKVCNREIDWGFYLRITDAGHRPIKGLIYGKQLRSD